MLDIIFALLGIDDERLGNLNRTWNSSPPKGELEVWRDYRCDDKGIETGDRVVVEGRKYQQLQGPRPKR